VDSQYGAAPVEALLRHLAVGLSTYRLYPGDVAQPAFRTAAEGIWNAATAALADGPVAATIRAGRFYVDGHWVASERIDRLAEACFSRRVEYVRIDRRPTLEELAALYEALSRDPDVVAAAGGVGALLDARGVGSIAVLAGAPAPTTGDEPETDAPNDQPPAGVDPDALLPVLGLLPGETAEELYDRLRATSETVDEAVIARSSFFRRAADVVVGLDESHRGAFASIVLDRMATDAFAERYAGHLTDPGIAELLAAAAHFREVEPFALAVEFVRVSGRQLTLVNVVRDLVEGGSPHPRAVPRGASRAARGLRDGFPADAEDGRRLALLALRDYLRCDPPREQLEPVLAATTRQLGHDVRDGAVGRVRELLEILDDARPHVSPDAAELLRAPRRHALTPAVVARAVGTARAGRRRPADVLRPFGAAAVDALVTAVAGNPQTNDSLLAALAEVVSDRPRDLEPHLDHDAWTVVRDLAKVLARVGGPASAALLERLVVHGHAAVRREALQALAGFPATESARALARVLPTMSVRVEQKQGLDALAGSGAPEAPDLLRELGTSADSRALPWRLRRRARRLARQTVTA
jgi:hypothetical protein